MAENNNRGQILGYQYEPRKRTRTSNRSDEPSPEGNAGDMMDVDQPTRIGNTDWCECGKCKIMPTERESVCCKEFGELSKFLEVDENGCITSFEDFYPVVLLKNVLWTALVSLHVRECKALAKRHEVTNRSYRYAAYRQFCYFAFSNNEKKVRVVLPSCVVNTIREAYPSPDGIYVGFKDNVELSEVDDCWSADGNCAD